MAQSSLDGLITNSWSSVRPALVTSPHISTMLCFRPYKPHIFWKLMALTNSESLSTDPLTTHRSPTQTHQTLISYLMTFYISHSCTTSSSIPWVTIYPWLHCVLLSSWRESWHVNTELQLRSRPPACAVKSSHHVGQLFLMTHSHPDIYFE